MQPWKRSRGRLLAVLLLACACSGQGNDPPMNEDPSNPSNPTTPEPTNQPAGFAIGSVEAWNANLNFVADVVQLPSGEVVAVGQDLNDQGAVHLVTASQVTVLHAGLPLATPTSVDLDADGTIFLTDAGGGQAENGAAVPTDDEPMYPTGGVFSMTSTPGTPTLVTDATVSPQGLVASAGGILYVTGFTSEQVPAVFSVEGGTATAFASGPPLVRPGDISVVNDPDNTQIWVIDASGGQDGVSEGGANLVALNPPDGTVIEVEDGMSAIGVTGRGPDALVTVRDHNGESRIQIVDVTNGERRDVKANGIEVSDQVTGAGSGGDPTLPVWAGGNAGQVFVTLP